MNSRLNYGKIAPGVYEAMDALDRYVQTCAVEKSLIMLVQLRVSQINGCAYCLDMHWKDLTAIGEHAQRLYSLDAWRECPYYTDRERAALTWAEAVTLISRWSRPGDRVPGGEPALQRKRTRGFDARRGGDQRVEPAVHRRAVAPWHLPAGVGHGLSCRERGSILRTASRRPSRTRSRT